MKTSDRWYMKGATKLFAGLGVAVLALTSMNSAWSDLRTAETYKTLEHDGLLWEGLTGEKPGDEPHFYDPGDRIPGEGDSDDD